jgi:glucarate dehydratase
MGELHELYLSCGLRERDDTGYRQSVEPGYRPRTW